MWSRSAAAAKLLPMPTMVCTSGVCVGDNAGCEPQRALPSRLSRPLPSPHAPVRRSLAQRGAFACCDADDLPSAQLPRRNKPKHIAGRKLLGSFAKAGDVGRPRCARLTAGNNVRIWSDSPPRVWETPRRGSRGVSRRALRTPRHSGRHLSPARVRIKTGGAARAHHGKPRASPRARRTPPRRASPALFRARSGTSTAGAGREPPRRRRSCLVGGNRSEAGLPPSPGLNLGPPAFCLPGALRRTRPARGNETGELLARHSTVAHFPAPRIRPPRPPQMGKRARGRTRSPVVEARGRATGGPARSHLACVVRGDDCLSRRSETRPTPPWLRLRSGFPLERNKRSNAAGVRWRQGSYFSVLGRKGRPSGAPVTGDVVRSHRTPCPETRSPVLSPAAPYR